MGLESQTAREREVGIFPKGLENNKLWYTLQWYSHGYTNIP